MVVEVEAPAVLTWYRTRKERKERDVSIHIPLRPPGKVKLICCDVKGVGVNTPVAEVCKEVPEIATLDTLLGWTLIQLPLTPSELAPSGEARSPFGSARTTPAIRLCIYTNAEIYWSLSSSSRCSSSALSRRLVARLIDWPIVNLIFWNVLNMRKRKQKKELMP